VWRTTPSAGLPPGLMRAATPPPPPSLPAPPPQLANVAGSL